MSDGASAAGRDRVSIIVGILLIILAGVLWYDAVNLGRTVAYGIGPAMMPKVVATGLVVLGLLSMISGFRSEHREVEPVDVSAILIIIGGFLLLTVCIGIGAGFVPAMTILFAATSYAFGRRALVADIIIGAVLATLVYLLFSKLLALSLPRGPFENLFG